MTEYANSAPSTNAGTMTGHLRTQGDGGDWPRMLRELMDKDPNVRVTAPTDTTTCRPPWAGALPLLETKLPRDRVVVRNNVARTRCTQILRALR